MTSTVPVMVRPTALITRDRFIRRAVGRILLGLQQPGPVPDHAELADA